MIEIKGVSKTFGDTKAVKDLNMTVNSGEIFGFLGSNGAGKTTTIKMIVGINEIDKGKIYVEGIDVSENSLESKSKIACVPDNPDIFEITDALPELISSYSHSMKQKIVLISALVHDPEVLILDDPMVVLDTKSSFELKNIMR